MQALIILQYFYIVMNKLSFVMQLYIEFIFLAIVSDYILFLQFLDRISDDRSCQTFIKYQNMVRQEIQGGYWRNSDALSLFKNVLLVFQVVQFQLISQLLLNEPSQRNVQCMHILVLVEVLLMNTIGGFVERGITIEIIQLR